LNVQRYGGMTKVLGGVRAPSMYGTFLRVFTFGHVRQLDAVADRTLAGLATAAPRLLTRPTAGQTRRVRRRLERRLKGQRGIRADAPEFRKSKDRAFANPPACARRDSNPHTRGHQNLNLARLPIPPLAREASL
jgi:hypothetical protein